MNRGNAAGFISTGYENQWVFVVILEKRTGFYLRLTIQKLNEISWSDSKKKLTEETIF